MQIPLPRFPRTAKFIAVDSLHKVALVRRPSSQSWQLPQGIVGLDESYADVITRLRRTLLATYSTRTGNVVGHHMASGGDGAVSQHESWYYIVRVDAEPPDDVKDEGLMWAPRRVIGLWLPQPEANRVGPLIDGYLDGWLPDGPITLG